MTDNLLDPNPGEDDSSQFDTTKDYLKELVGEGKKFKDVNDLAKGKAESDSFISSITKENNELRKEYKTLKEELQSRARLEELVDKIALEKAASVSNADSKDDENETRNLGIKPEDVKGIVSQEISRFQSESRKEANLNLVRAKLQERFGNNYRTSELADRIGVDEKYFVETAATHPNIILKTLGLDGPVKADTFQTPPTSSKLSGFKPDVTERTESYYKKLAAEKGVNIYLDREISLQMHKDAQRLGEAFFDARD